MSKQAQGDHPGYQQEHGVTVPAHAAATATEQFPLYRADRACRLRKVDFVTGSATVTGNDNDTTNFNLKVNATEKGAKDLVTGTDLAADTKYALYAPATPLALAAGDIVYIEFEKVGNGVAIPEGILFVSVIDFEP